MLVNDAGVTRDGLFREMSSEQWHIVIETNLNSLFHDTKQVIDAWLASDESAFATGADFSLHGGLHMS